jgi:Na+-driven multidrug efflux pump
MWFGADFFVSGINEDPAVMTVAVAFLHIVPLSIGFMGMMTVATHGFNALRRPLPALWLSIARLVLVYLPLALIGRALFGYIGIFWATAIANLVLGLISAVWLKRVITASTNKMRSAPV